MSTPSQRCDAKRTSRCLGLALAFVLAIAQALIAEHRFVHSDAVEHADCALCLAGGSLDHAAPENAAAATTGTAEATPPAAPSLEHVTTGPRRATARSPPTSAV